jgi:translation initiation factor 1
MCADYDPSMSESRLVYSTDGGDRRRSDRGPVDPKPTLPSDGIVRIFREKGGRGGKTVTVVRGLPAAQLQPLASELKRRCGSGGAVKADAVEIQGDHRGKAASVLEAKGYRVKLAGG